MTEKSRTRAPAKSSFFPRIRIKIVLSGSRVVRYYAVRNYFEYITHDASARNNSQKLRSRNIFHRSATSLLKSCCKNKELVITRLLSTYGLVDVLELCASKPVTGLTHPSCGINLAAVYRGEKQLNANRRFPAVKISIFTINVPGSD